jgi:hypothetical protein
MNTRGVISKTQKDLHLNEDIYAGMNAFGRGGLIKLPLPGICTRPSCPRYAAARSQHFLSLPGVEVSTNDYSSTSSNKNGSTNSSINNSSSSFDDDLGRNTNCASFNEGTPEATTFATTPAPSATTRHATSAAAATVGSFPAVFAPYSDELRLTPLIYERWGAKTAGQTRGTFGAPAKRLSRLSKILHNLFTLMDTSFFTRLFQPHFTPIKIYIMALYKH